MEVVEAVAAAADDRQGEVELGRARAGRPGRGGGPRRGHPAVRSRDEPRVVIGAPPGRPPVRADGAARAGPGRSARAPRGGPATPRPRASAAGGSGRCRSAASTASTRAGGIGSCRVSTLWIILRRSRNEAWTSRQRSSISSAVSASSGPSTSGSTTMTAEFDGRLGLERGRRHPERDADRGVGLDEHGQVAHRAGRGRDPLGDLALDHEHGPGRPGRRLEQPMEDRARDVVGQVRDDVVRRREQRRRAPGRARRPR